MRIALMDDYQKVACGCADWSGLPAGCELEVFHDHLADRDALAKRLANFDIAMALRERTAFPAALLERLPRLKMIPTAGPRNASIDVEACTRLGIVVCHTAGGPDSTSELTWGLILSLLRHIPYEHHALRGGRWQTTVGTEVGGRVLGTIGLGHIGTRVARVAQAFGMRVLAWSQNLTPEKAQAAGAQAVSLEQLLRESDVVTIHTRLSDRTRGLLGAKQLAWMRPSAVLINSSRGPIVDEAALVDALRSRRIAGAGIDVYDVEPLPANHPYLALDNVVLTPHLGYVTHEVYRGFYGQTLENIVAYLNGEPKRVLNPDVWDKRRRAAS
jgi:phosphoglycerate dehydrogenase-like enzyme